LRAVRKAAILVAGWLLVFAGVATLVLPGPGLLLLFGGLALLATEYAWARARVEPVKARAMKAAVDGVRTRTRIAVSILSSLAIVAVGVVWWVDSRIPEFGVLGPELPFGGWATGVTLVLSGLIALLLVIVSIHRFRSPGKTSSPTP